MDCTQTPRFAAQWWDNQPTTATARAINVVGGQIVRHVDAALARGAVGSVSGKLVNLDGAGMTVACVVVYLPNQYACSFRTRASRRHEHTVPDVPSGSYAVGFLGCGNGGGDASPTIPDPAGAEHAITRSGRTACRSSSTAARAAPTRSRRARAS